MKFYALSLFAIGLSAPAFAGSDQFDLLCRGTVKRTKQNVTENMPWMTRYKIDLNRKIFCTDRCLSMESIYEFDDGSIYLNNFSSSVGMSIILISLMSGKLSKILTIASPPAKEQMFESVHATCQAAAFSGIPRKF